MFTMSVKTFIEKVRVYAEQAGVAGACTMTSHAFRRGMAQEIVSQGGSLADLLRAGSWQSKAFLTYLRDGQIQDKAVAEMIVCVSDSDDEHD